MTTLRKAATLALEAMEREAEDYLHEHNERNEVLLADIAALKAALAEPPDSTKPVVEFEAAVETINTKPDEQVKRTDLEPVAWMDREGDIYKMPEIEGWAPPHTMLYTAPLNLNDPAVQKRLAAQWGYVKGEQR